MAARERLIDEIETLPNEYIEEVMLYVENIKKRHAIPDTMLMSEESLAREWDTPEEDSAWANL